MSIIKDFFSTKQLDTSNKHYKVQQKPRAKKDDDNKYNVLANDWYQCDLMYMPRYHNYEYCFCIINMRTKISDVEPIVYRTSDNIKKCLERILHRNVIQYFPAKIFCDLGSEFRGSFNTFCESNNIELIYTRVQMKTQNSLVENINNTYKQVIMKYLTFKTLENNQIYTNWIDILYDVRDLINKYKSEHPKIYPDLLSKLSNYNPKNLKPKFKIGQFVHVLLDFPTNSKNERIPSYRFRHGMERFSKDAYEIVGYRFTDNDIRYSIKNIYGSYPQNSLLAS